MQSKIAALLRLISYSQASTHLGLQVFDLLGVNKPFKDYMRGYWEDFMVANVHHIAQWVEMAWARVSIGTVTNTTWKSIGFEGFAAVN
jgi:hypothetical protein